jgi:2-amino-4-hydroxy-6-hydroxymethyldihydropteridine diphosphokinase
MTHIVFIALGSNLGDRSKNLKSAIDAMKPAVQPIICSPVYETPPWGYLDQPKFLNQVVWAETDLSPVQLLDHLKGIEKQLGRVETLRNGPRTVDLDILFYDDLVFDSPGLKIPHPRLVGRAFVLLPLAQIAPDLRHPQEGRTIQEMLAGESTAGITLYSSDECNQRVE